MKSSSLNFQRNLVHQLKPVFDPILNLISNIERQVRYSPPALPEAEAGTAPVDAVPKAALSPPSAPEVDDSYGQPCASVEPQPSLELPAPSSTTKEVVFPITSDLKNGPKAVSAALLAKYNRQNLFEKVWKANLRCVAGEIGVFRKTLSRICKELHIPIPPSGFWLMSPGHRGAVSRPLLPEVQVVGGGAIKGGIPSRVLKVSALLFSRYDREELYRNLCRKLLEC